MPDQRQMIDCWYAADCTRRNCPFIHPRDRDESLGLKPFRDDKKIREPPFAGTYRPDRVSRDTSGEFGQASRLEARRSTTLTSQNPRGFSGYERPDYQRNDSFSLASNRGLSQDHRRKGSTDEGNITGLETKPRPINSATMRSEFDKMDIDQPMPEPQESQPKHTLETKSSRPISRLADTTWGNEKTAVDTNKQAYEENNSVEPQLVKPLLQRQTDPKVSWTQKSPTTESTHKPTTELENMFDAKALLTTIDLRVRILDLERQKRLSFNNLEKYKTSIAEDQNKEAPVFKKNYKSEKNKLQRIESDLIRVNGRCKLALAESTSWTTAIPQHTATLADYGKEKEALKKENELLRMVIGDHDKEIHAMQLQISRYVAPKERIYAIKDEVAKIKGEVVDRVLESLETTRRERETKVHEKDTKNSQELLTVKNNISDTFNKLTALKTHQTEITTTIKNNVTRVDALDVKMTEHMDRILGNNKIMESRHTDLAQRSAEFQKQLTDGTELMLQTYKMSVDNIQSQINDLTKARGGTEDVHETLGNLLQAVEDNAKNFIGIHAEIATMKRCNGEVLDRQLHLTRQHEASQSQVRNQIEKLHRQSDNINARVESLRYLEQNKGNKNAAKTTTPAMVDIEATAIEKYGPEIGFRSSNTNPRLASKATIVSPLAQRVSVTEMQLLSLRQRFDTFTMDQYIESIINAIRRLWPHTDTIMRRLEMMEHQFRLLEQATRDWANQLDQAMTSKAEIKDLEQLRAALNTAVVSIANSKQHLYKSSEAVATKEAEIDIEKLGPQCLAFLGRSADFSALIGHLFTPQYQLIRNDLNGTKEDFDILQAKLSNLEEKQVQQEIEFEVFKSDFENFKHEFHEALEEQVQQDEVRSERLTKKVRDLAFSFKTEQLKQKTNSQPSDNRMLATDSNIRSSLSSITRTASVGLGSSMLQTRKPQTKKRKLFDDDDDSKTVVLDG